MRFDEMELNAIPIGIEDVEVAADAGAGAPLGRRALALFTDLSLFGAVTLALSPLLPLAHDWTHVASLAGFVVVLSYHYFVCTWLVWGKTIGGAIFDVRVVAESRPAISVGEASLRWLATYLSLLTGGAGFVLAALPSRRSLPDRLSGTRCE
jgi:uncharacterized RDD family membrane protein YckC